MFVDVGGYKKASRKESRSLRSSTENKSRATNTNPAHKPECYEKDHSHKLALGRRDDYSVGEEPKR